MNTSPRRNIDAERTTIACMFMKALENELKKGQEKGDATKVVTGIEIEMLDELTPRVEANSVGKYDIVEKDRRNLLDGKKEAKIHSRSDLEYKLATMKESKEVSLEDDYEI